MDETQQTTSSVGRTHADDVWQMIAQGHRSAARQMHNAYVVAEVERAQRGATIALGSIVRAASALYDASATAASVTASTENRAGSARPLDGNSRAGGVGRGTVRSRARKEVI